jgi:hypothetical protein
MTTFQMWFLILDGFVLAALSSVTLNVGHTQVRWPIAVTFVIGFLMQTWGTIELINRRKAKP